MREDFIARQGGINGLRCQRPVGRNRIDRYIREDR